MIYLVGVDHLVQYNGPVRGKILDEFSAFLDSSIRTYGIAVIAEEFNEEFLRDVYFATRNTAEEAAKRAGIIHIYCDPDEHERQALGIPYHADIKDSIRRKYGTADRFIPDGELRNKIDAETVEEEKSHWEKRERFWLERLRPFLADDILFLCGHEHVTRFKTLLDSEKILNQILDEFWRRDLFSDYGKLGLE